MVLLKHVLGSRLLNQVLNSTRKSSACIQMLPVVEKFPFIESKSPKQTDESV